MGAELMGILSRMTGALMRRTQAQPTAMQLVGFPQFGAGEAVTESTSLTVPGYTCCVRVISESISQMDWRIHSKRDHKVVDTHPVDRLLNEYPNPEQEAAVWRELMLRWVLMWGNAYCEIVRDASARPVELWPVEPWRVEPVRADDGTLWYKVHNPGGSSVPIPAADMLHFRGLGDSLLGFSVIGMMARVLGLSIAQENSMAGQMQGARPSGVLTPANGGSINKEKAARLQEDWTKQNAGSRNHGKVILLSDGLDWHQMHVPNSDAQMIESRQFSVLDCCRFMRVPPHMVYELSRATFSNITHQSLEFSIHTTGPWCVKLQQQANRKLISRGSQREFETRLDPRATLRMDPATRTKYYRELRDLGAINANEIRAREDLAPIGSDGDVYFIPGNMTPVEKAIADDPKPQPAMIPGDDQEPEETDTEAEDTEDTESEDDGD